MPRSPSSRATPLGSRGSSCRRWPSEASSAASGTARGTGAARSWRASSALEILFTLALLPLLLADSIGTMVVLMTLAGLALAPTAAAGYLIVDHIAPPGTVTEATTWVMTANVAGGALGAAIGGVVVQEMSVRTALVVACAGPAIGTLIAVTPPAQPRAARAVAGRPARAPGLANAGPAGRRRSSPAPGARRPTDSSPPAPSAARPREQVIRAAERVSDPMLATVPHQQHARVVHRRTALRAFAELASG